MKSLNETYVENLKQAMTWLADQPKSIFVGQAVCFGGTGLYDTLSHIDIEKRQELPVAENFQVGYATGLALGGYVPISTFPRWNFLILGTDQIVNHLDKLSAMSDGQYCPKVIIRVACGSQVPINPQQQHVGDFSDAFRLMCSNIDIVQLHHSDDIIPAYQTAWHSKTSTILVEYPDYGKL